MPLCAEKRISCRISRAFSSGHPSNAVIRPLEADCAQTGTTLHMENRATLDPIDPSPPTKQLIVSGGIRK